MIQPGSSLKVVSGETTPGTPSTESRGIVLLIPLNADADAALSRALNRVALPFERCDPFYVLECPPSELPFLRAKLQASLAPPLQASVKAVFQEALPLATPQAAAALAHAEALPLFFEQTEVFWAHDALRDGWLFSVFHPILDASTGATFAYEALMRARNPQTDELIGAGQLLYACERLNLLHQFDQQARLSCVRDAAALQFADARFFVNFLPTVIYDPELCLNQTLETAAAHGLPPGRIVFEVVETEQTVNTRHLLEMLEFCRSKGAAVALDDISGYSPLQFIVDLRPDYVKIDRDVVANAASGVSARHTLDSIVELSKKLNAKVIAEGVETPEQMELCVRAGVDYVQGFLFARPAQHPQRAYADQFAFWPQAA